MYKLSKRSIEKLSGCHEDIQIIIRRAIRNSPFDFAVTHGHRTPEEQNKLYQKGRKEPGEIVTYKDGYENKSKHNEWPSEAVDIAVYKDGDITWDSLYYQQVADHIIYIANQLIDKGVIQNEIYWGGDWSTFKDYPHFQI